MMFPSLQRSPAQRPAPMSRGGMAGMGPGALARPMSAPAGAPFAGGNSQGQNLGSMSGHGFATPNPQRQPLNMAAPRAPQMGQAAMMLSDERSKETIRALRSRLADLSDGGAISPAEASELRGLAGRRELDENPFRPVRNFEYGYKPEFQGQAGADDQRHIGPMAQDLEGIPGVVNERPDGMKQVDAGRLSMATAGEVGAQRRELDELRARLADLEGNPDAVLDVAGGRR